MTTTSFWDSISEKSLEKFEDTLSKKIDIEFFGEQTDIEKSQAKQQTQTQQLNQQATWKSYIPTVEVADNKNLIYIIGGAFALFGVIASFRGAK
jgi:hypothetical protein